MRDIQFDEQIVPADLHELIPLAHVFGVGDDGVRAEVIEIMPDEFVAWARQRVLSKADSIREWVATGWDDARSALLALVEGFGHVDYSEAEPDPQIAAKILDDLRRLKL